MPKRLQLCGKNFTLDLGNQKFMRDVWIKRKSFFETESEKNQLRGRGGLGKSTHLFEDDKLS